MDMDSPSPTRPRSVTVVHHPLAVTTSTNPDRGTLLTELGEALMTESVPAAFWACVQIADLESLKALVQQAKVAPAVCAVMIDTCYSVPRRWMQRPLTERQSAPSTSLSSSAGPDSPRHPSRSMKAKDLAKKRAGNACTLTRNEAF